MCSQRGCIVQRVPLPQYAAAQQAIEQYGWSEEEGYIMGKSEVVNASTGYAEYQLTVRKRLPAKLIILQVEN